MNWKKSIDAEQWDTCEKVENERIEKEARDAQRLYNRRGRLTDDKAVAEAALSAMKSALRLRLVRASRAIAPADPIGHTLVVASTLIAAE